MLILFDVDGTLFCSDDQVATQAMADALTELTGANVTVKDFEELDHRARCARWLARETIRRRGLREVDLAGWAHRVEQLYLDRLTDADTSAWHAPDGAHDALAALCADGFELALLTGVPERIARRRMDAIGLGAFFAENEGGFGSEADERDELIALALERAGADARDAVHVGDTSRDVRTALDAGISSIAVAFDGDAPRNARRADAVVHEMRELPDALRALTRPLRSSRGYGADRR